MPSRDIVRLLREQDERLRQTPMGPAMQARIERQLREASATRPQHEARWVSPLVVGVLASAAVILAWGRLRQTVPTASPRRDAAVTNSPGETNDCTIHRDRDRIDFSGRCRVQLGLSTIRTDAESEIQDTREGVQVIRGKAWFEVARVPAGAPSVRVRVGGGVIEVLGTKFVVDQNDREGSVDLLEGRIRFVAMDGAPVDVRPGERFRWTNVVVPHVEMPSPPVDSANAAAAPQRAARSSLASLPARLPRSIASPSTERNAPKGLGDAGAAIARESPEGGRVSAEATALRVMRLRAEGRYEEAMTALAELHAVNVDAHTAEILSFEEGNILEHLEDGSAICAHWKQHLSRFPGGQYRSFVAKRVSRLGCP
jgi:hypothetical protein